MTIFVGAGHIICLVYFNLTSATFELVLNVHWSLSLNSAYRLHSGAVRSPQHASLHPDLRRPSDSRLSHPLQLHRPAQHHRQHYANVSAWWPVERLTATLLWYGPQADCAKLHKSTFENKLSVWKLQIFGMKINFKLKIWNQHLECMIIFVFAVFVFPI